MKVIVYREYEVDTDHLDPSMVKIREFVKDEALRMLHDDYVNNDFFIEDFNAVIV